MNLSGKNILLTGATGGIGRYVALQLAAKGAILALVGSNADSLHTLSGEIAQAGGKSVEIVANLEHAHAAQGIADAAVQHLGSIDILINNAGVMDFILFEEQSPERIAQMVQINVTAPIQLTRAVLPGFIARNSGHIVNIGSTFGSIGFPHYASYCATKFAMRGFSQALRRELVDSNIKVTYVAPRAVKTPLNDDATTRMLMDGKIAMDDPQEVATKIVRAIELNKQEHYIGQPEAFFAWLNSFLPKAVNIGLKKQSSFARPYAARKK
ncbi:MAG: SDR family oxidoreductase [Candidatus Methylopumilus sp.]|jgi:short-subunit dehydrogenase